MHSFIFLLFFYFLTNATGMGFKCDSANGMSTCELFQTPQELPQDRDHRTESHDARSVGLSKNRRGLSSAAKNVQKEGVSKCNCPDH